MDSSQWITLLVLAGAGGWSAWSMYTSWLRNEAIARLRSGDGDAPKEVETYPSRFRWAPPVCAALSAGSVIWFLVWRTPYAAAAGALCGVIALLAEEFLAGWRIGRIERQLVDAIDILVSSLRAGSSLPAALESVREAAQNPLRIEIEAIAGRIRMGEDPRGVLRNFGLRVPLESFQLFSHALQVHWDSGGSLAGTLLIIGRTIRDRIEISRRIQAQAVESQISVIAILAVSYGTGLLMYLSNPGALREFILSTTGMWIVVFAVVLQAIGMYWIWRMSQVRF